ncbi:glycosyltransferase [Bifidobacterium pullorum subsp. saeculare]|uniref:Glycosyltransferase n=2 Tax=Bifidobacterium pullorum TaxID=78448 RepID=A0A938WY05_9BIFI|nr:glycosyltransferase [Bifidobacterium pullorum subsp. saeculare]
MSVIHKPIRILQWGMTTGLGGLETFLMGVYRHIDRSQVQFDFLQAHDEGKLAFEDEIRDLGGHVYRVMVPQRESFVRSRRCLAEFFAEHREFAGVHVNANFRYAFPLRYAKRAGIGLRILHSHNIAESHAYTDPVHELAWRLRTCSVNHDINTLPTHYFACSAQAAEFMFPGRPFTWIRNGIDTAVFAFDADVRNRLRHELGIARTTTVLGFCGNLREQKAPLFLIDIFDRYHRMQPDSKLLIVGDGVLRDAVERRITDLGLTGSVLMLGQRTDVADLYQAMDAFVLPSRFEGLGIVYIEAQCAGLPSFAPEGNVPPEVRASDLMTFVPRGSDAESWAWAIDRKFVEVRPRANRVAQVRAAGYEMADVAAGLQEFYLTHAEAGR